MSYMYLQQKNPAERPTESLEPKQSRGVKRWPEDSLEGSDRGGRRSWNYGMDKKVDEADCDWDSSHFDIKIEWGWNVIKGGHTNKLLFALVANATVIGKMWNMDEWSFETEPVQK